MTIPEIAVKLDVGETVVIYALARLELTESRAHSVAFIDVTRSSGSAQSRRYDVHVVGLLQRETRGLTGVMARSTVRTWNPETEHPIDLEITAIGIQREQDGVAFIDCTEGGITERVVVGV